MDIELLTLAKIQDTEREMRRIQLAAAARAKQRQRAAHADRRRCDARPMPLRLLRALGLAQ